MAAIATKVVFEIHKYQNWKGQQCSGPRRWRRHTVDARNRMQDPPASPGATAGERGAFVEAWKEAAAAAAVGISAPVAAAVAGLAPWQGTNGSRGGRGGGHISPSGSGGGRTSTASTERVGGTDATVQSAQAKSPSKMRLVELQLPRRLWRPSDQ